MSAKPIEANDDELERLMADLEVQNEAMIKKAAVDAAPAPVEAPVVEAPVVVDETPPWEDLPPPVDLTRKVWIHNEDKAKVYRGTVADLDGNNVEVTAQEGVALAKKYKPVAVVAPVPEPEFVEVAEPTPLVDEIAAAQKAQLAKDAAAATEAKREKAAYGTPSLRFNIDVDEFRKETAVSDLELDRCMIEQSGHRAFYGAQAANAEAQASRLKARFGVIEATLYNEHRKAFVAAGEKTTEKMIENAVLIDPRWLSVKNQVIESETIAAINKSMVDSLRDRKDILVQLSADRREELKGEIRVVAKLNDRDELRERALAAGGRHAA